jgi:hypothetical protein
MSRSRPSDGEATGLGWLLQLLALGLVGAALLVGLAYDALRAEVAMLAAGGALFLIGRRLGGGGD